MGIGKKVDVTGTRSRPSLFTGLPLVSLMMVSSCDTNIAIVDQRDLWH